MKRFLFIFVFWAIFINLGLAQTAEGFFNLGANLYIKNRLNQAIQVVQEGLRKFPNDHYLKALAEKLKQKKQQQKQQQQQNQQQGQQKKQQQKKANEGKKKQQDKEKQQAQKQNDKKKGMTKKEAERILRALKEENKKFKKEHLRVPAGRRQLDKNW